MKSEVFFTSKKEKLADLFEAAKLNEVFTKKDIVALKIHFGEPGNTAFLRPEYVIPVIKKVREYKGRPFLTDANTLYSGKRQDTLDHLHTAFQHGYTFQRTKAHIIISDGIYGRNTVKIKVDLKHFKEISVAAEAVNSDSLLVLSHFKGHEVSGFGGAIKNLGMGLGTRAGKQMMHADVKPKVDLEKCTGCEVCVRYCPTNAITMKDEKAQIDLEKCIGCAECIAVCRFKAIAISWAGSSDSLQEKMAEYCYGIIKKVKNLGYINYVINVSPNCDCYDYNDPPIVDNIGFLASKDIVTIDQACCDLVNKTEGRIKSKDKFRTLYPDVNWEVQLEYAEKIGLGKREYTLIEI
jgi:uncharacterized Fe-S center protein